jgi:hypothetical protein
MNPELPGRRAENARKEPECPERSIHSASVFSFVISPWVNALGRFAGRQKKSKILVAN